MSGQRHSHSFLEACVNMAVAFPLSYCAFLLAVWLFNVEATWDQSLILTLWMTVFSLLRVYAIRRWFNFLQIRLDSGPNNPHR